MNCLAVKRLLMWIRTHVNCWAWRGGVVGRVRRRSPTKPSFSQHLFFVGSLYSQNLKPIMKALSRRYGATTTSTLTPTLLTSAGSPVRLDQKSRRTLTGCFGMFLTTSPLLVLYILNRMVEQKTTTLRPNPSEPAQNWASPTGLGWFVCWLLRLFSLPFLCWFFIYRTSRLARSLAFSRLKMTIIQPARFFALVS